MKPALRISLNVLNAFVLPFGVFIAYEAFSALAVQLEFPKETPEGLNMEIIYGVSAFFGLLVTTTGIMGVYLVNIDALILRTLYSIILGTLAAFCFVIWIATHELMDHYTDDMVFRLYYATLHYNELHEKQFLDEVQQYAQCCGSRGVKNFRNQTYLPISCCPPRDHTNDDDSADGASHNCTNETAYHHTCEVKATRRIVKRVYRLSTSILVVAGYFTFIITLEMWF